MKKMNKKRSIMWSCYIMMFVTILIMTHAKIVSRPSLNFCNCATKGILKNYGDNTPKAVSPIKGDGAMCYATIDGSKQASNGSGIFSEVGKVSLPAALADGVYTFLGHLSYAFAYPIADVLNVRIEAVSQIINSMMYFLLILFAINIVLEGVLGFISRYEIYKGKEAKLHKNEDSEKTVQTSLEEPKMPE